MTPYIVQLYQSVANKPQTSSEAAKSLGWPTQRGYRLIRELMKQNLIRPVGQNPKGGFIYAVEK